MLHKKRKPSTFTSSSGVDCKYGTAKNNMLHSKSTYFYRWLSNLGIARRSYNSAGDISNSKVGHDFANEFRESSHHCEKGSTTSGTAHAILTRSRRQTNSYSKITDRPNYIVPVGCSLALLLGLGIIFNPATSTTNPAHAETVTANPTDYSSISLTISNNGTELNSGDIVSTNVEPGLISYISNNLKIDTKKINRFYVSVQAAENGTTELTGTANKATIAPVGNNKIPTATDENGFGDNTWGFALGETSVDNSSMSYNSLPAYGTSTTPQYSSATNLADGTYNLKLTFAAKINANKPSDHYTTKAMVSVAADAVKLTWDTIGRMQDMTSEICAGAASGDSKQLIDSRDSKQYWIAKLADGKCWMTQNLDLDITADGLKAIDSDLAQDWNAASQRPPIATITGDFSAVDTDATITQSWDPGNYLYLHPSAQLASCGSGLTSLSSCSEQWREVDDTYTASNLLNTSTAIDNSLDGITYDAHYLIGNFYSWSAATAGTNDNLINGQSRGSLCPKGWVLPPNGAFGDLFNKEGINDENYLTKIMVYPTFLIPSGFIGSDIIDYAGQGGYWWSGTFYPDSAVRAYLAFYNDSMLSPAGRSYQYIGRAIRCVAK